MHHDHQNISTAADGLQLGRTMHQSPLRMRKIPLAGGKRQLRRPEVKNTHAASQPCAVPFEPHSNRLRSSFGQRASEYETLYGRLRSPQAPKAWESDGAAACHP